jgi:hypothetical protein
MLPRIKGTLARKDITISISLVERNNYVRAEFTNQLVIPKSYIIKKVDFWDKKQYDINDLQMNIEYYIFVRNSLLDPCGTMMVT